MATPECWLIGPLPARDGQSRLHWLTPLEHGHCEFSAPRLELHDIARLRDRQQSATIDENWPAPLLQALRSLLSSTSDPVRIRLALRATAEGANDATVRAWQRTAFESLKLDARPLTDRLVLEREAPAPFVGVDPIRGDSVILNTWYPRNREEPERVVTHIDHRIRAKIGYQHALDFLTHENLSDLGALAVIAHGACEGAASDSAEGPFLARVAPHQESPVTSWALPSRLLPPLVVILACSSDRLELVEYTRGLLMQGARCVLVPIGRIDAVRAAAFLGEFLRSWHGGATVIEALRSLRAEYLENVLDRMWILGNGALRHETPTGADDANYLSDLSLEQLQHLLADAGSRTHATAALADRATLLSIQSTGGLRDSIRILNHGLGVQDSTDDTGRRLQRQLDEAYPACSRVTRGWLANYLMGLSERYDHDAMRRYRVERDRDKGLTCGVPVIMKFAAMAAAREGHYLKSARSLIRGFQMLDDIGEDLTLDRLDLTGTIVGHLIDFNLPRWAVTLINDQRIHLTRLEGEDADFLAFISLDRMARAQFRGGNVDAALATMLRKRNEALARGERGHRELAGLVYMAAWYPRAATRTHLDWAREASRTATDLRLSVDDDLASSLVGNDDLAYLLRALSAWHWARPEPSLAQLLEPWIETAASLIEGGRDPGPWGFLIGYLAATGSGQANTAWETARAHMLDWEYRLEVLGLEWLRGVCSDDHHEILRDFQRTRAEMIDILVPVLQRPTLLGPAIHLQEELQARSTLEQVGFESLPTDIGSRNALLLVGGLAPI